MEYVSFGYFEKIVSQETCVSKEDANKTPNIKFDRYEKNIKDLN